MDLIEKATIRHFHRHRIDHHKGGTVEALGWRDADSQRKRFEVISSVVDPGGCAVLDVGCGHGDLKGFLARRFDPFSYTGIDQMPEFITEAEARYGDCPNTWFFQTDFTQVELPVVDYVFASGALGYRSREENFHFEMIAKMFRVARQALVFNMLDVTCFPDHDLLVGHDRERVERFCRELAPDVEVVRGYLEDDFTVVMRR